MAFLLRGYQEDGVRATGAGIAPGTALEATLPIWRVAEGLLHASYLAGRLNASAVSFAARYTGFEAGALRTVRLLKTATDSRAVRTQSATKAHCVTGGLCVGRGGATRRLELCCGGLRRLVR
jgi:hypothetical protein